MPIIVGREGYERDLLECVQRIIMGLGEPKPPTIDAGREAHAMAVMAVNDAQLEIYTAAKWDFRFAWGVIDLESTTMWYSLPYDYSEMATDMPVYLGTKQLTYIDFRDLLNRYPDFRLFPPGAGTNLSVTVQGASNTNHFGEPMVYTVTNDQIGLFPVPDDDWIETQSQAIYGYYDLPTEMIVEGDLLSISKELWTAHFWLSLGFLKQYLEYPDWQADEQRGRYALEEQVRRLTLKHRQQLSFKPDLVRE